MSFKFVDTYRIPVYALSYLVNGDASGLEDDDLIIIHDWLEDEFGALNCLIFEPLDEHPGFDWNPAFGLPVDTVAVRIFEEV